MQFNPDKNKQAVQVIFSPKSPKLPHPPLYFNQADVLVVKEPKHLGMILDSKLNFSTYMKEAIVKARRGIGMIPYMAKYVSRVHMTKFISCMSDPTLITAILYMISMILNLPMI